MTKAPDSYIAMTSDERWQHLLKNHMGPKIPVPTYMVQWLLRVTNPTHVADAAYERGRIAGLRQAAYVASNACLVPPDGGSPTEDEVAVCDEAYRRILALIPDEQEQAAAQTLISGPTVEVDMGSSVNFELTLDHNATLSNPTGGDDGQSGYIKVVQSGAKSLSYGSAYHFNSGAAPVIPVESNSVSLLSYNIRESGRVFIFDARGVKE